MNLRAITLLLKNPTLILQKPFPGILIPDELAIKILYKKRFGYRPNLKKPSTFNEKVLWLTLHDRNPKYSIMVDKYNAKNYIKEKLGEEITAKNLKKYYRSSDIDFSQLPRKFVLKCNHDSGSVIVCNDRIPSRDELKKLDLALKKNYYWFSREWPYKSIKPCIFAEEYIEGPSEENGGLIDYKLYCMNGIPYMFCLISDRKHKAKLTFVDLDWNKIEVSQRYQNHNIIPEKPVNFDKMLAIARILSKDIPFLRVDYFEDINKRLYIGELTFTPSSGLIPFEPREFDKKLGKRLRLS